jgi:hypothetical protein
MQIIVYGLDSWTEQWICINVFQILPRHVSASGYHLQGVVGACNWPKILKSKNFFPQIKYLRSMLTKKFKERSFRTTWVVSLKPYQIPGLL